MTSEHETTATAWPTTRHDSVCVVGLGARTAIGASAPASAAAVRAGISSFAHHPYMVDDRGEPVVVAMAPYLANDMTGVDRFLALSAPAAAEALIPLREAEGQPFSVPIILGLPPEEPWFPERLRERLCKELARMLPGNCRVTDLESVMGGHAAGLMALGAGCHAILNGRCDLCLVGGVDTYLTPKTLYQLNDSGQLHGGENSWGFTPGEGSGFCLLASRAAVEELRLTALGRVLAVATTKEEHLINTNSICLGKGLTHAALQVIEAMPDEDSKIAQIICDANGEPYRADELGLTTQRVFERLLSVENFLTPADCWGDVRAASGPLFITVAIAAGHKGYAKGPYTLLCTSSRSGERCAAIMHVEVLEKA